MAGGIEEFAEQLRALKDRSGLSYGALAKRLHMSTSTVHRYCNGGAVPAEYAPVERFARLCKATPQELVELHRRWILADDARRSRVQGEAEARTPEPAAAEPPAPTPTSAPAESEPSPEPSPAPEPEPQSGPEPELKPIPRPRPGEQVSAAVGGRRSRRVRLGIVAAAAVGMAVPTALVAWAATTSTGAHHDDTDAHRARSNVSGAPLAPSGAPGNTAPGGGDTASPDGRTPTDGTGKTEDGGKKADGKSGAREEGGASDSKDSGGGNDSGEPLTADVQPYALTDRCDTMYVSGRKPAEVPEPPSDGDARAWVTGLRAVPGGRMHITVDVQGKNGQAVVLRALHVRVVKSTAPLAWSGYSMGDGCGGGLTPAFFDIDLDRDRPTARPTAGEQGDVKIPATDFPYKVSSTDPQPLDVLARTTGHDVTWYLELEWSSGGRSGTMKIDDHGQPFRTTAVKDRPQYGWQFDQKVWQPLPDYGRR